MIMVPLEELLSPQVVARLGWTLVHFVWQAASVALLLAVVLRILRRRSASARYIVACLALALTIALPIVTIVLVKGPEPVAEAGSALTPTPIMETTPVDVIEVAELPAMPVAATPVEAADVTVQVPWTQRAAEALEPALPYLVAGWLLGVFGLSTWHLGGWAQLQRMKRRMVRTVAAPLQAKLIELASALGVRRAVALLESALVEVPTVVGWIKPVILLPASVLSGLSSEQLEAILAHELAHIRRCDYLVNIIQTVVEILGFYHPALWWISHKIRIERENCCDDLAVQVCGDSVRYARALTCLEEMRHHHSQLAVAASGGSLIARIGRLLGRPAVDDRRFAWLPGLITLLLVAATLIPTALVLAAPNARPTGNTNLGNSPDVQAEIRTQTEAKEQHGAPIRIETIFANAPSKKVLDRETKRLIGNILATEYPQMADLAARENVTLGEILRRYVAGKHLPSETMEALTEALASRGYLEIEAAPSIQTRDNVSAQVKIAQEMPIVAAGAPTSSAQYVDLGFTVQATPHLVSPSADRITLEIEAQWTELAEEAPAGELPAVRTTEIASTVTVPPDRYFSFLLEPDQTTEAAAEEPECKLILFKADRFETIAQPKIPSIPLAEQTDGHPRQVLLDARIVSIDEPGLADLGIEWRGGIDFVYASDQTSTDSLLSALNRLQKNGQATIVSNPQVLAQDGKASELGVTTEEYYMLAPPVRHGDHSTTEMVRIKSGTELVITPRIGDDRCITLEIVTEVSDSIPGAAETELPVVKRRKTRNVATIKDGGTVALAGVGAKDVDTQKQLVILVTASFAPETDQPARPDEANTLPAATLDAPAPERADAERALEILREELARIEEEIRETRNTWSPRDEGAPRAQRLEKLEQYKSTVEQECEEVARLLDEQVVAPDEPEAEPSNSGVKRAERVAFWHTDVNGTVDRRFGFASLIDSEGVYWILANPWMNVIIADARCCVTASRGEVQLDPALGQPFPSRTTFSGNVLVNITPADSDEADGGVLHLDEATFIAEKNRLSGTGAVRFVCGGTEFVGQGLELFFDPPPTRPNGTPVKTFNGIDLYLGSSNQLTIVLNGGPTEPPEPVTISGTITATFEGEDLRVALQEIAAAAGVTIAVDPNVSGEVWARLDKVPFETALETLLGGTPFVTKKTPDYYLVSTRDVVEKAAVSVEARFVLLDKALMEALQRGLPIEGAETPEDVNALHAIGADLLANETPLLKPAQVGVLLRATRQHTGSKSLAAPKVTVLDGESASFRLTESLDYTGGYREPNDASADPVPLPKSKDIGIAFDVTPRLIENDNVRVTFDMEVTSLLDMQTALYQGTYEYSIPSFETVTIESELVIPDGQTAIIRSGEIRSLGGPQASKDRPAAPSLILITPRKTVVLPAPSTSSTPSNARIGAGGMEGF